MRAEITPSPERLLAAAQRTVVGGLAVLLLTTVHHLYGAYVYGTPWRNHVAHVAGLGAAVLVGALLVFKRQGGTTVGRIALGIVMLGTLVLPVIGIGLFEGGYNHAAKLALYFAGSAPAVMQRFFPPPTYELPNDAFFEVTGVLQLVLGLITGRYLLRVLGERRRLGSMAPRGRVSALTTAGQRR